MDAITRGRRPSRDVLLASWSLSLLVCVWSGCYAAETPRLVFTPRPLEEKAGSRLIWIRNDTWEKHVRQMDDFLQPYQQLTVQSPGSYSRCSWDSPPDRLEKSCVVNVGATGTSKFCNRALNYGYDSGRPCIFINLEKMVNWIPEPYTKTDTTGTRLPEEVRVTMEKTGVLQHDRNDAYVWFNCEGEFPADKENLGPLNFSPMKGIPTYFFPYQLQQQNYLVPFLTLHIHQARQKVALNVVCRAYAKNILQQVDRELGATHFQLLIDYTQGMGRTVPDATWPTGGPEEEEHGWSKEDAGVAPDAGKVGPDAGERPTEGHDGGHDGGQARNADHGEPEHEPQHESNPTAQDKGTTTNAIPPHN